MPVDQVFSYKLLYPVRSTVSFLKLFHELPLLFGLKHGHVLPTCILTQGYFSLKCLVRFMRLYKSAYRLKFGNVKIQYQCCSFFVTVVHQFIREVVT